MPPEPSATDYPFVSPDRPDSEAPHFVAQMFFLTQVGNPFMHTAAVLWRGSGRFAQLF